MVFSILHIPPPPLQFLKRSRLISFRIILPMSGDPLPSQTPASSETVRHTLSANRMLLQLHVSSHSTALLISHAPFRGD
ncbi:hypothetical protein CEXT_562381 [Caerostris extrusa]|uniref:Uncharacterized protein n=1 Tax=Caerostris extrusa TaxID=172846 RepID=A0AAV4QBA2_CAEEX|nr:hypothetical protein CEXT_562381 [Caerostris extrusa]